MAEKDADVQKIKELIKIMKENDLVEVDIKHGEDQLSLRRAEPAPPSAMAAPFIASVPGAIPGTALTAEQAAGAGPAPAAKAEEDLLEITSPIVGTFYEAPSPDSDPYIEIGASVDPQTVARNLRWACSMR